MSLTTEELRDTAQALDLRNRHVPVDPDWAMNERIATAAPGPKCACQLDREGNIRPTCGNGLTIIDVAPWCRDCRSGAHYH